jgi:RNA polymerase sigma factor (sigma-70 family)
VNSPFDEKIEILIQGCIRRDKVSQKMLYKHFYSYAMSICLRYSKNSEEATEVLNDGFMKVFTKINMYDPTKSFKGWIRKIMINTALDNYRQNLKYYHNQNLETTEMATATTESVLSELSYQEILNMVQQLSPAYRTVFNLYVIDGYTHEEIAELLHISVGTSKSNLSKARERLRQMFKKNKNEYARYTG